MAYDPGELQAPQRNVVDTDVILWHIFGLTHVVQPEDFPVMPTEVTGFTLRPHGFFDENPPWTSTGRATGSRPAAWCVI